MDTPLRLIGPEALTGTPVALYTVPAATTTIVRSIHVINTDAAVIGEFTLSLGADAVGTRLFDCDIPVRGTLDWHGFIVMETADALQAAALAGALTLTVNGIEVTA